MKYVVTVNQTGYLPDNVGEEFDTEEEARQGLAAELEWTAEASEGDDPDVADALKEAAVAPIGYPVRLGGWAHTIQPMD